MTKLKRLDLNQQEFIANGKKYRIENGFSIERYCEYQALEKELAYGLTFKGIFDALNEIFQRFNKGDFAMGVIKTYDLMQGVKRVGEREPVMLKMCALFINREDEDRATITEDMIAEKIEDWKAEGYDITDFFTLALNTMDLSLIHI